MILFKKVFIIFLAQWFFFNSEMGVAQEKLPLKTAPLSTKKQMAAHTEDLRNLMLQLYETYPNELAKSTQVGAREMTEWVFDGKAGWKFEAIRRAQRHDALALFLAPSDEGDAILPLVVGLETLLFSAYGAKNEFDLPDEINPPQLSEAFCTIKTFRQALRDLENNQKNQPENIFMVEFLQNKKVQKFFNQTLDQLSARLVRNVGVTHACSDSLK